jgi:hypothetical protein
MVLPMRARRRVRTIRLMHDTIAPASHRSRATLTTASLVAGPLLMSIGDLIHPSESNDPADQAAILVDGASRWYGAHLLLLVGAAVFVPGVLALSQLATARRPANGDVVRVLLLIGLSAFWAIFACEMLVGRYAADGASESVTGDLLRTLQSGPVLGVLGVVGSAFFMGVAAFAIPFIREGGEWRVPSLLFALGALLVLVEIISAQVVFSQVGNVMMAVASWTVAWRLRSRPQPAAD